VTVRYLLIGSRGFIGSQVRRLLWARPHTSLVTLDRTAAGGADPAAALGCDLARCPPEQVAELVRRAAPDVVLNCAGVTLGGRAELVAGNVVAVATLLDALGAAARGIRLVHLGSAGEYGPVPHGTRVREDYPPRPVHPYGISKLAGTALVVEAAGREVDPVVLRVANPVGRGAPPESLAGHAVRELRAAAARERPAVFGPLTAWRDFVDVRDVASAVLAAAEADTPAGTPVFNVGSGRAVPARALVDAVAAVVGFAGQVEEAGEDSGRSRATEWQQGDISAAAAALGWRPVHSLSEAAADLAADPYGAVERVGG
jgi:NDP-hexose 4-ketoreductase